MLSSETALLVAAAVHAGFQTTVTVVVYPALARVPAPGWADAHRFHSRAITPVVVVVYGLLVAAGAWSLTDRPGPWTVTALAAAAAAMLVTAVAAAPTHGRLGAERDSRLVHRLLQIDRVRLAAALVSVFAATAAVAG